MSQYQFYRNFNPRLEYLKKMVLESENNWLNKMETEFVQCSLLKKEINRFLII